MPRMDKPEAPRGYTLGKEVYATAELDNLTLDVLEAEALGYGCRYGDYKAAHPYTKQAREEAAAGIKTPPPGGKLCKHCKKPFIPLRFKSGTLYCSEECRILASNKRATERRQKLKQQNEEAIYV